MIYMIKEQRFYAGDTFMDEGTFIYNTYCSIRLFCENIKIYHFILVAMNIEVGQSCKQWSSVPRAESSNFKFSGEIIS